MRHNAVFELHAAQLVTLVVDETLVKYPNFKQAAAHPIEAVAQLKQAPFNG